MNRDYLAKSAVSVCDISGIYFICECLHIQAQDLLT